MMGAVADGARAGGAHTLGVIPQSLVDLEVADVASDELIVTADMGARKNLMIERSDAFLTLPGGLGTLDELFEVWTTATLDLHAKPIVLLDPDGFYDGLLRWLGGLAETAFVRTGGPGAGVGGHVDRRRAGRGRTAARRLITPGPASDRDGTGVAPEESGRR